MDTLLYGAGLVVMGNTAECLVLDHQIRPVAAMAYRSARTAYWTTKSGPLRPWLTGQPGRRIGPPNQARCGHGLQVSQDGANSSDQVPQLAPLRNRLAREGAMLVAAVLSFGAPLPFDPPCIRHRCLPFTAGDEHGRPDRVRAPQRGARRKRNGSWVVGCMGLAFLFIRTPSFPLWTRWWRVAEIAVISVASCPRAFRPQRLP